MGAFGPSRTRAAATAAEVRAPERSNSKAPAAAGAGAPGRATKVGRSPAARPPPPAAEAVPERRPEAAPAATQLRTTRKPPAPRPGAAEVDAASAPVIPSELADPPLAIAAPPPALVTELGARGPAVTPPAAAPSHGASQPQRLRGVVQWFGDRGYGFIRGEDGRDVFVHRSAIGRGMFPRLIEGQLVEYEVQHTGKGPQAAAVTPLQSGGQRR